MHKDSRIFLDTILYNEFEILKKNDKKNSRKKRRVPPCCFVNFDTPHLLIKVQSHVEKKLRQIFKKQKSNFVEFFILYSKKNKKIFFLFILGHIHFGVPRTPLLANKKPLKNWKFIFMAWYIFFRKEQVNPRLTMYRKSWFDGFSFFEKFHRGRNLRRYDHIPVNFKLK